MSEREPMACNQPLLPPEIWGLVLPSLSRTDQRSCLSVCTTFRDLARALLFSRVVIRFGMWWKARDVRFSASDLDVMKRRFAVNREVLQHIARDASFARLIRTISVRACDATLEWSHSDDFQNIINALKATPNLQSFQWYGSGPHLPSSVLDALTKTCGSTVSELDISGVLASDEDASQYLAQFQNLQTLSLAGNFLHSRISDAHSTMIETCIENAPDTIRRLSVWGDSVWATPLHLLSRLQELSLITPESLDGLGAVFTHCAQLRSLDIVTDSVECEPQMCAALESAPADVLPHLTSFKFICRGPDAGIEDWGPFAAFLRGRHGMRRLDLEFNAFFEDVDDYARFLDIFAALPQLEVVGLALDGGLRVFTWEHLRLLDAGLPSRTSALLLTWAFMELDDAMHMHDWAAMLGKRPSLGYVHILDGVDTLDLRDALRLDRPRALELVGYGDHVCNIGRDWETGDAVYAPRWGQEAIGFGTEVEFGCADWAWLLRSHDWDGL